jgi:hypothetical protein
MAPWIPILRLRMMHIEILLKTMSRIELYSLHPQIFVVL